jgi:bifunctional UDP-N-acetylglucosamine pyrophosphorylase/glucosamine-1-phosphate N-acetyltransferase
MDQLKAIILAAGEGKRMKSDLPKVLHKVCGKTMVDTVIDQTRKAGAEDICVIVGYKADTVKASIGDKVVYAVQEKQLGTGHAVMQAVDFIGEQGDVVILCGDTPLITAKSLKHLIEFHKTQCNSATVLTAILEDSTGYGHIIRDNDGDFVKIVEYKDANDEEKLVKEINTGMYVFAASALKQALSQLKNNNAQGEYYLTDTLEIILKAGMKVDGIALEDFNEALGVNSPDQLLEAEKVMQKRA